MLASGHWFIGNQLHRNLNVTFKEDANRARKGFAAQNLSIIRKLALQVVKSHNGNRSIRKKKIKSVFVAGLSFRNASICTNLIRLPMRLPCDFFTRGFRAKPCAKPLKPESDTGHKSSYVQSAVFNSPKSTPHKYFRFTQMNNASRACFLLPRRL